MIARNADPTTMVGRTNGTVTAARKRFVPRNAKRANTYAPGRPSASVSKVDTPACHTVNQTTRLVTGSVRTSPTAPGSHRPSGRRPRTMMRVTGHTKNTPMKTAGTAASAATPMPRRRVMASSENRRRPAVEPSFPVLTDRLRVVLDGVRRLDGELGEHVGQGGIGAHGIHVHLERHVLLELLREHEVDELVRSVRMRRALQHARELDLAEAAVL